MKTNKIGIELNNFIWNGIEKFMIRNDMKMIKKTLLIIFWNVCDTDIDSFACQ